MSEFQPSTENYPKDEELLPSQIALHELCEEMLALKPIENKLFFVDIPTKSNPKEIRERLLSSSLGDLMLNEGDSLSARDRYYYEDLNLYVRKNNLVGIDIKAWQWMSEKVRYDTEDFKSPKGYTVSPDEKDWENQLDISIWYSNRSHQASETISASTAQSKSRLPYMSIQVSSPTYAESGYEGHYNRSRPAKDEAEVLEFIELARELFDERIEF